MSKFVLIYWWICCMCWSKKLSLFDKYEGDYIIELKFPFSWKPGIMFLYQLINYILFRLTLVNFPPDYVLCVVSQMCDVQVLLFIFLLFSLKKSNVFFPGTLLQAHRTLEKYSYLSVFQLSHYNHKQDPAERWTGTSSPFQMYFLQQTLDKTYGFLSTF